MLKNQIFNCVKADAHLIRLHKKYTSQKLKILEFYETGSNMAQYFILRMKHMVLSTIAL